MLQRTEVLTFSGTGGGGGLSASPVFTAAVDCSRAAALLVRFKFVKSGVDLTLGIVDDASDSANTSIAAEKIQLISTLQSTGTAAPTHALTNSTTSALAVNLGGLVKNVRLAMVLSGAGAVGDTLDVSLVLVEEGGL